MALRQGLSIRLTTSSGARRPPPAARRRGSGFAAGVKAGPGLALRLVNPIDADPSLRPARDDSGFGFIGLEASIRANTECVGECRDRRGGAVV